MGYSLIAMSKTNFKFWIKKCHEHDGLPTVAANKMPMEVRKVYAVTGMG